MRLQPLDNAASPAFMGVWEPYTDGNWLSFDLDFTNGPSDIECARHACATAMQAERKSHP